MNYSQLKALLKINVLFVNPQITGKLRKKGKPTNKIIQSILNQYLMLGGIFLLVYGLSMVMVDFKKMPGMYTYYLGLFLIISLSQGVATIYNIFFESKDLESYVPLPFGQKEIFLSKFLTVLLGVVPFILPIIVLFYLGYWRGGFMIPIAIIAALISFLIFVVLIFECCSFIVFGLVRIPYFQTHKKQLASILLIGSSIVSIGGILLMTYSNNSSVNVDGDMIDRAPIKAILPFYWLTIEATSTKGIICFFVFVLLAILGFFIIQKWLMPKLFEQLIGLNNKSDSKRTFKKSHSFRQVLVKYNSRLFDDINLLLQIIMNSFMMPIILIISFGVSSQMLDVSIPDKYAVLFLIGGLILSYFMISAASFVAVIISVDRENFTYIRSLPIKLSYYLKVKFIFAWVIQLVMVAVVCLLAIFMFKLTFLLSVMLLIGAFIGAYVLSEYYFWRDYRLLEINWTNVSQLFTRGAGTMGMMLNMFGSIIVGSIVMAVLGLGLTFLPPVIVWIPTIGMVIGGFVWSHFYFKKKYWSTVDY